MQGEEPYISQFNKSFRTLDVKNDKAAQDWMKKNYADYIKLSTQFVSPSFLSTIRGELENTLEKDHLIDLYAILPDNFGPTDLEHILRHISTLYVLKIIIIFYISNLLQLRFVERSQTAWIRLAY